MSSLANFGQLERCTFGLDHLQGLQVFAQILVLVNVLVGGLGLVRSRLLESIVDAGREILYPDDIKVVGFDHRRDGEWEGVVI